MKAITRILSILLILTLAFPFSAFSLATKPDLTPDTVTKLEFTELEKLLLTRNLTIRDTVKAYTDAKDGRESGREGIDQDITQFESLMAKFEGGKTGLPADSYYESAISYLLQVQYMMLLQQRGGFDASNIMNLGFRTDTTKFGIVWSMEKMFLSYHNLVQERDKLVALKNLAEHRLRIENIKMTIGMGTEENILDAESQLAELELGVKQFDDTLRNIRDNFNINLGQDTDVNLILGKVPEITKDQVTMINFQSDYERAVVNSFAYRIEKEKEEAELEEKRKFKNSFTNIYETMLAKNKGYEAEKTKLALAQRKMRAAELKHQIGLISTIMYQKEISDFKSREAAATKAYNEFYQAYREYEWAKRGVIFGSM